MNNPTLSIKHFPLNRNEPCSICGAIFVPAEDSGSRVLRIVATGTNPDTYNVLMCGGCHSKWSHGVTVTCRTGLTL
ncbi:MAG TPA: hypothetical protein VHI98_21260 [Vicinamibacterales bacterium]|jgi:hypothetical protein|nr:hypothetical protein [Vicinamibacterales bacterium]